MMTPQFSPMKGRPGWCCAETSDDQNTLETLARTLNTRRPPYTYFICGLLPDGEQYGLFRVETRDPLRIIKAFQVGSHAKFSYGEDAHPTVMKEMAQVHARNPIVPFFADAAGLKCSFEQPINSEFAELLDSTITEGIDIYADEGFIGPAVMRDGFLHLWWD